jgi:hypothetical protein
MRKNLSRKSFVIAGAAALFAGLAGNMQAAQISIQNNSEAGVISWVLGQNIRGQDPQGKEIAHFIVGQAGQNQISANPDASLSGSVPALSANSHGNLGQPVVLPASYSSMPLVTMLPTVHSPTSTGQGTLPFTSVAAANVPASISVPDGGSTALMLGGVFFGLAFLRKNSKPAQTI